MKYPNFEDINDIVPADFQPNCFSCPGFVSCLVPTKLILMFGEILLKVPEAVEQTGGYTLSEDSAAEVAINVIEEILREHQDSEHDKDASLKLVNTLRALEYISRMDK